MLCAQISCVYMCVCGGGGGGGGIANFVVASSLG